MEITSLNVRVIGWTTFAPPADVPWETDTNGGQALAEFAGRACYQSWSKPNPATATNAGYLRHILEVGHFSVLEHGSATVYLTGVSRSLTHELIRHRHFSYSQQSQRYVSESDAGIVIPPAILDDDQATEDFLINAHTAIVGYNRLVRDLEARGGLSRKEIRQAARAILPNAVETRIVVTGNYRAWRHFIALRATEHADVEIRAAAVAVLRELQKIAPNIFADFTIGTLKDGSETASTPYAERS